MKTKEELIEELKKSKKNYSDEQIKEIADRYEICINNRVNPKSRKNLYSQVAKLLNVDSLNDVRFYKIMNVSAVVVRDIKSNKTKVAFSFYSILDLINDCKLADKKKMDSGKIIYSNNNIPILHQITIGRAYSSCYWSAYNYSQRKFFVEFNELRISELAIYEAWIKLCKNNNIPRYCHNLDINCQIVSLRELRNREALAKAKQLYYE